MTNDSLRFHDNTTPHKGVRMATSQHISIFLFCCNQKNKRRLKIEYQAQKVSLESRILKKKVRGKVNTLPPTENGAKGTTCSVDFNRKKPNHNSGFEGKISWVR